MTAQPVWTIETVTELLSIFDEESENLYWQTHSVLGFAAKCSDFFAWACADAEDISPEDLPLLKQCKDDLIPYDEDYMFPQLYACRKREMRPMRLWFWKMDKLTHEYIPNPDATNSYDKYMYRWKSTELFLAVGPERDPKTEG